MRWLLALPWERGLVSVGGCALFASAAVLVLGFRTWGDERPWLKAEDVRPTAFGCALVVLLAFLGGLLAGWGD